MPFDVFYQMNPKRLQRYLPFFNESSKEHIRDASLVGWMNGTYMTHAINAVFGKHGKYPEEPTEFLRGEHPTEEIEEFTDADRFGAWAMVFNKANFSEEKVIDGEAKEVDSQKIDAEEPVIPTNESVVE